MPRTTLVLPTPANAGNVTVTTSQTNLLAPGTTITAGSNVGGAPLGDADAYALVIANTGATNMDVILWLSAGSNAGLRAQLTATVNAGAVYTYQVSGNAARAMAVTATVAAGTTTARADLNAVTFA